MTGSGYAWIVTEQATITFYLFLGEFLDLKILFQSFIKIFGAKDSYSQGCESTDKSGKSRPWNENENR
jgi:hypothetical protein